MTSIPRSTFPGTHRLKKNRDFQRVYAYARARQAGGQRYFGQGFTIIVVPNAMNHSRLGISVQKKTGTAVRRNRIKRLIREVFRLNREHFPKASDIVFAVRPGFVVDHALALREEVLSLLAAPIRKKTP